MVSDASCWLTAVNDACWFHIATGGHGPLLCCWEAKMTVAHPVNMPVPPLREVSNRTSSYASHASFNQMISPPRMGAVRPPSCLVFRGTLWMDIPDTSTHVLAQKHRSTPRWKALHPVADSSGYCNQMLGFGHETKTSTQKLVDANKK